MRNNEEVKAWLKKIKRKKAISLQQNLAVIMSLTVAAVLSGHTAVTARTCPIVDLKVASDIKIF
jgi:hypothetical protein